MATQLAHRTPRMASYRAGASLAGKLYTFVKAGSAVGEVVSCGDNEDAIGIVMSLGLGEGVAGTNVSVALPGGGALLQVAGAVAASAELSSDADGKGVASAAGELVRAKVDVIDGTTSADDIVAVEVVQYYKHA